MKTVTKNAWPLYLAAFAMSAALGIWWTAMPFILRNIGGTEEHVGYAPAANMFGYMCGLFVMGSLLHHVNPRQASRSAAAIVSLATLVICVGIYLAGQSDNLTKTAWIWIIIVLAAAAGIAMAFFWPFLMSWVSAGYEGLVLNQRLGYYNSAWSGAGLIGPFIGAVLVDIKDVYYYALLCLAEHIMTLPISSERPATLIALQLITPNIY
jgi:MFS family permease